MLSSFCRGPSSRTRITPQGRARDRGELWWGESRHVSRTRGSTAPRPLRHLASPTHAASQFLCFNAYVFGWVSEILKAGHKGRAEHSACRAPLCRRRRLAAAVQRSWRLRAPARAGGSIGATRMCACARVRTGAIDTLRTALANHIAEATCVYTALIPTPSTVIVAAAWCAAWHPSPNPSGLA